MRASSLLPLVLPLSCAAALLAACGGGEAKGPVAPVASTSAAKPWGRFSDADLARYHSARIGVSFLLPERPSWSIVDRDDAEGGWLVARHAPSSTVLRARRWDSGIPISRLDCEAHAMEIAELPKPAEADKRFETLSDQTVSQPKGWDARHWVATETTPDGRLVGHVFLLSARKRTCLIVHARTDAASEMAYAELADRLELLSSRVVGGVAVEPGASPLTLPPPRVQ
jgi:hypothetical protein